jgi:phage-related protein
MATQIGEAYIQILPSAKGIKGSLTKELGGEAESAGKSAGGSIASGLVGAIKKALAAAGIGAALKKTIEEGADLEQSIGGIETLFGAGGKSAEEYAASVGKSLTDVKDEYIQLMSAQNIALDNAANAYKTAGLSANDYMQTVTGFAASLKQSVANETEAAKLADQAVIDMADNANKMGTDMSSIQTAYQGFAKQNYTMLDNLKLGYGGTKSEMERLLADAEELSGVKYDISNLGDVYSAIHVIQDELGITGTTAKEASQTFSGSLAAMQAAASNLMGNLALGQDIGPSLQALGESVNTFLMGNLFPMVGKILAQLPTLLKDAIPMITDALVQGIPQIISGGVQLMMGLGDAILSTDWIGLAGQIVGALVTGIQETAAAIFGEGDPIPMMKDSILTAVNELGTLISEQAPAFLQSGTDIIVGIVTGIGEALPELITAASEIASSLLTTLVESAPTLLSAGVDMLGALVNGLLSAAPSVISAAATAVDTLLKTLTAQAPTILSKGLELLNKLVDGIVSGLPKLASTAANLVSTLLKTIASNLPQLLKQGGELLGKIIAGIIEKIPDLIAAVPKIFTAIKDAFANTDWISLGKDIINGIIEGVKAMLDALVNAVKNVASKAYEVIKNFFKIGSPSKLMADEIGKQIPAGIAVGIEANEDSVLKAMNDLSAITAGAFNADFQASTPASETTNLGGVTININGEGLNSREIALEVEAILTQRYSSARYRFA